MRPLAAPLELHQPRTIGALLRDSARLWLHHLPTFFTLALIVVAPLALLIQGAWAGVLDGAGEYPGWVSLVAWLICEILVIPALVTAMHVVAVLQLGEGRRPSVLGSLVAAMRSAPALVAIVLLYTLLTMLGLVLFVIPGVFVAVGFYFGAQVRMAEGRGVRDSLRRSSAVVTPHWERAFVVQVLISLIVLGLSAASGVVSSAVQAGIGAAIVYIVSAALIRSYTSLAGTLLFFDLRSRRGSAAGVGATRDEPISRASRPFE